MKWVEVDEKRYDEALGCLPPALWLANGFLIGEAYSHRLCSETRQVRPTYTPLIMHNGMFFEGVPLTIPEFRAMHAALSPTTVINT